MVPLRKKRTNKPLSACRLLVAVANLTLDSTNQSSPCTLLGRPNSKRLRKRNEIEQVTAACALSYLGERNVEMLAELRHAIISNTVCPSSIQQVPGCRKTPLIRTMDRV